MMIDERWKSICSIKPRWEMISQKLKLPNTGERGGEWICDSSRGLETTREMEWPWQLDRGTWQQDWGRWQLDRRYWKHQGAGCEFDSWGIGNLVFLSGFILCRYPIKFWKQVQVHQRNWRHLHQQMTVLSAWKVTLSSRGLVLDASGSRNRVRDVLPQGPSRVWKGSVWNVFTWNWQMLELKLFCCIDCLQLCVQLEVVSLQLTCHSRKPARRTSFSSNSDKLWDSAQSQAQAQTVQCWRHPACNQ